VSCAAFKENVAAYVLGILEPEERVTFERHLAETSSHDGCREALAEAYETTALLGAALPPLEPGPRVWQAIERELDRADASTQDDAASAARGSTATRASSARRGASASRPASRGVGRRETVAWVSAIAAVAVAFVFAMEYRIGQREIAARDRELALAAATDRDKDICMRELASARVSLREREAALSLLGAPGTQLVQLAAQGGEDYHASALLNPGSRNAMILTTALKPLPGKDYQLWLIRGNEKISGGVLHTDASGAALARLSDEVLAGGRPDAFAVTIEPPGGMPQPTGPIILLGKVPA
jgi:anti-sigma-K factor RskA